MISRKFTFFAFVAVLMSAVITSADNDSPSLESQIRDLMTQKRDVLQERLDGAEQLYKLGTIKKDRVLNARRDRLNAELDLATSKADRITVLESQLANLRELEQLLARRYEDGTDTLDDKLIATEDRLVVEIALLR
jgi:outer membrane protein TolC